MNGAAGYTRTTTSGRVSAKPHRLFVALATFGIATMSHAAISPVLVIHGGAGVIKRDMTPAKERAVRAAMTLAHKGYAQL